MYSVTTNYKYKGSSSMKKLDITAVEHLHRVRQQSKNRVIKFREEQEKRGYKNLTVFLSKGFREELQKLSQEKDINRQQAMQYIFEVYTTQRKVKTEQSIVDSVTSNNKKPAKQTASLEPGGKPKELTGKSTNKKQPFNKAEICRIIVDLKDNKKMSYVSIARELKARGYRPQTASKKDFHHSTITNYYKESIKKH